MMDKSCWHSLINEPTFNTAKVTSFKHAPMTEFWDRLVTVGIKVEVVNNDVLPRPKQEIKQEQTSKPKTESSTKSHKQKQKAASSASKNDKTITTTTTTTTNQATIKDNKNSNKQESQHDTSEDKTILIDNETVYWIGTVVKVQGYLAKIRYEGYEDDSSKDFWIHLYKDDVHGVGWCAAQGKTLVPPSKILNKLPDWSMYLIKKLTGARTLPSDFAELVQESLKSKFKIGMKVEVVDKNRVSSVRVATVESTVGGRLLVSYDGAEPEHAGFWTHERSPLVHPIGWAQFVSHELVATHDYAHSSLEKVISKRFGPMDATWDMFDLPSTDTPGGFRFEANQKLEAIDPLNLSSICVATVIKVLRANYLMIGIDGSMCPTGSDWFCYHATSPYIFPTGFCKENNLELTNPNNDKNFNWDSYLAETQSKAAPALLFQKTVPEHGFEEGMMIEAVDLMQSRLVCVATISKVVGRLLRIHFNGWDETYDQWCDCESPDLFPIGWCQLVGYPLEPPKSPDAPDPNLQSPNVVIETTSQKRRKPPTSCLKRPAKKKKSNPPTSKA